MPSSPQGVAKRRWLCGLLSNYFGHMLQFTVKTQWQRLSDLFGFRLTLCVGCGFLVVWGAAVTCRADVIAWYSVFVAVNSFQLVLLAFSSCEGDDVKRIAVQPSCLSDVYTRVFKPMAVTRRQFVELVSTAWVDDFTAGTSITQENVSPIGDRLSLLLSGRCVM